MQKDDTALVAKRRKINLQEVIMYIIINKYLILHNLCIKHIFFWSYNWTHRGGCEEMTLFVSTQSLDRRRLVWVANKDTSIKSSLLFCSQNICLLGHEHWDVPDSNVCSTTVLKTIRIGMMWNWIHCCRGIWQKQKCVLLAFTWIGRQRIK